MRTRIPRNLVPAAAGCACCVILALQLCSGAATAATKGYESYFMYLWEDPHYEVPGFFTDSDVGWNDNVQGLAHDDGHWFVTTTMCECDDGNDKKGVIWKIPVGYDLANVEGTEADVSKVVLSWDLPDLYAQGYWHVGDPDRYGGVLVVPIETCNRPTYSHALFFFDTETLAFLGKADLPGWVDLGWVAVNPANGHIYASPDNVTAIEEYELSPGWSTLAPPSPAAQSLVHVASIPLWQEDGSPLPEAFHNTQGGAFSELGSVFYFLAGINHTGFGSDGLHAFDTSTWRRILRSSWVHDATGCEDFYYTWEVGGTSQEEPEGLDVWDLDDQPGPYWGQLHVVMLDNDHVSCLPADLFEDDLTIFHYTNVLYVNATYGGGDGRPGTPFATVQQAYDKACDGARLKIVPDTYPEYITFSKRVILEANGPGTVWIGTPPR